MLARVLAFFIIALSLSGCSEPLYTNIDNTKLQSLIKNGVPLYDIRRPDEWKKTGVIEGSRLLTFIDKKGDIPPSFLPTLSSKIGKNDPVILICRSGNRSSILANYLMEKLAYTTVYNVEDGITPWIREKKPLQKP
ncbi:MAG: rhodanese-like domain-containing protein [Magnetococcales bacterium]|nr:rhodanese-like domain-containing protein [Magnetococcales bacterium]